MENTLVRAQSLYEQGKYSDAIHAALEVVKSGQDVIEADLLAANCALRMLESIDDDLLKRYEKVILAAFGQVKAWDEFMTVSQRYRNDLWAWCRERHLAYVAQYEENFSSENKYVWPCILDERSKLLQLSVRTETASKMLPNVVRIAGEMAGATEEEIQADLNKIKDPAVPYAQKFDIAAAKTYQAHPISTDFNAVKQEVEQAVFDAALRIFNATYDDVLENNVIPSEYLQARKDEWIAGILAPEIELYGVVPKEGQGQDDVRMERLTEIAQVHIKQLQLQVVVNNNSRYFLTGDVRTKKIGKLKKVYEDMKKLDPNVQTIDVDAVFAPPAEAPQKSGGCYVATCVYGSYDCPQVWTLRRYRDNLLAKSWYGRAFICMYYAVSPTLVQWFGQSDWFKNMWKPRLDRMVGKLNTHGFENTPYQDKQW